MERHIPPPEVAHRAGCNFLKQLSLGAELTEAYDVAFNLWPQELALTTITTLGADNYAMAIATPFWNTETGLSRMAIHRDTDIAFARSQ